MDKENMRIGCVLLASGQSMRFQGEKLLADFQGEKLYMRALNVVPEGEFSRVVVVGRHEELLEEAKKRGFQTVVNEHPEAGLSHSIALGIGALEDTSAILFLVADQPLLRKQSICNALTLYRANPDNIVALAFGERRGNPCIFPRAYFGELFSLTGDMGGSAVINAHKENTILCYAQDGRELIDVDTVEELYSLIR